MVSFTLNGQTVTSTVSDDTPLLWVVRDEFKLKGSKFGCGAGLCGACTLHIDGKAQRSCVLPVAAVAGKTVTTIEGLGSPQDLHPLQRRWAELGVPQCGYCQSGQIMSAAALLSIHSKPTEEQVEKAMAGNICRCGCYPGIKQAIMDVATQSAPENTAVAHYTPGSSEGKA